MENMENEKPYSRRENRYFYNYSDIKNCFPIIYNNCPKYVVNELSKIQKTLLWNNYTPKIKRY